MLTKDLSSSRFDFMVVGAGFSGVTLAERLASQAGKKVLLVERDPHVGGLMYDYYNEHGLLVHGCGLHVFHTNSQEVVDYLSQFTKWNLNDTLVAAMIEGKMVPFPLNRDSLNQLFGLNLKTEEETKAYVKAQRIPFESAKNAEEAALNQVGPLLYEKFFQGYTRKWWGRDPKEIDSRVTARISIRPDQQRTYQNDKFQGVPSEGYSKMFERMVDHPNITLVLNQDYRGLMATVNFDRLIFTGNIDEFFDYSYGKLPYRTMRFTYETHDMEYYLPVHQVMYPNDEDYMRVFEFKHATLQKHPKTTIIREFPTETQDGMIRHYPVPIHEADEMYAKYKAEAERMKSVTFLGRLAQYRYYTMGQTVARSLTTFRQLLAD